MKPRLLFQEIKEVQLGESAKGGKSGVGSVLGVDEATGRTGNVGGREGIFLLAELQLGGSKIGRLGLSLVHGIAVEDALSGGVVEGIAKRA